ncbi:MAG: transposase [Candidatus Thermoplasmatota archaeon]|nr:transposase [Candidatus Thermoplasmatota archaeon]
MVFPTITSKNQTIEKVVKGKTYVYERIPYYNPKIKNTSYHYRYVGRKDDGGIRKIGSVLPRRSLIHGPFIPIMKIVNDLGIVDMLMKHLTESESREIISIAVSKIIRPLPLASIDTWFDGTSLSRTMNADLKSKRISDLLERIGKSDLYRQFSSDLISRINPGNSLLYGITSLPSYESAEILEYGHAKDHPELEQINLGMVMERSRNMPLFFEIYGGSIPDVAILKRTVEGIRKLIPKIEIILDRGFFSYENLSLLKNDSYIIAASLVSRVIKNVFSSASRTLDRADNVIMYDNEPIFCKSVSFTMDDLNLRGYFCHDPRRESDERSDFHRKLAEKRSAIEKLQIRPNVRETIESIASHYGKYFTWRIEDGKIKTMGRNNAISAAENRMGRFLLVYNGEYTPQECLSIYRNRDSIEKAFRILKTDLDIFPMRVRKESTIRGMLFIFFISLIIRTALMRGMVSSGLMNRYSLEKLILELEKLHVVEDANGSMSELERTRKQKDILEALEKVSWW